MKAYAFVAASPIPGTTASRVMVRTSALRPATTFGATGSSESELWKVILLNNYLVALHCFNVAFNDYA